MLHLTLPEESNVEMTVQGAFAGLGTGYGKLLENIDIRLKLFVKLQPPNILYKGPRWYVFKRREIRSYNITRFLQTFAYQIGFSL